jgi:hypothetical protein
MAIIPISNNNIMLMLQNDCQQWRTTIAWAKQRYQAYNQNCTAANMTAASISVADQAIINAFVGDLNRFIQLAGGTLPTNADDMIFNLQAVLGIM